LLFPLDITDNDMSALDFLSPGFAAL